MKKTAYAVAIAVFLTVGVAQISEATNSAKPLRKKDMKEQDRATATKMSTSGEKSISLTGTYSGVLSGKVRFKGRSVIITKRTVLRGPTGEKLSYGSFVAGSNVFLAGTVAKGNRLVATMIIVSPEQNTKGEVGELDKNIAE